VFANQWRVKYFEFIATTFGERNVVTALEQDDARARIGRCPMAIKGNCT
jgi:hypothetical protein